MSAPSLSVIVVSHNHARFLDACLRSVTQTAPIGTELIVVDNRSDDRSAEIARSVDGARVLVPAARQGFSANCNLGLANASGRFLLLLNPDTEVRPGALQRLVRFMEQHPRAGMAGALLRFPDGSVQPSARRFPTLSSVVARRTPLRVFMRSSQANRHHLMQDERLDAPRQVDWLLGACMCVRREVVRQVGPLDEGYFLYVEDIDWARRMHRAGFEVWFVPDAEIVHHHLAESDHVLLGRRTVIHTRSMWRYARKYLLPALRVEGERTDVWRAALEGRGDW